MTKTSYFGQTKYYCNSGTFSSWKKKEFSSVSSTPPSAASSNFEHFERNPFKITAKNVPQKSRFKFVRNVSSVQQHRHHHQSVSFSPNSVDWLQNLASTSAAKISSQKCRSSSLSRSFSTTRHDNVSNVRQTATKIVTKYKLRKVSTNGNDNAKRAPMESGQQQHGQQSIAASTSLISVGKYKLRKRASGEKASRKSGSNFPWFTINKPKTASTTPKKMYFKNRYFGNGFVNNHRHLFSADKKRKSFLQQHASKALQRSFFILSSKKKWKSGYPASGRRSVKKIRQNCSSFVLSGKCKRGSKCSFVHDPNKVAVCTKFLRGACLSKSCPFSHTICADKMPLCKFFLQGACGRANCPYLHVKHSDNAKICIKFQNGFCQNGAKCSNLHLERENNKKSGGAQKRSNSKTKILTKIKSTISKNNTRSRSVSSKNTFSSDQPSFIDLKPFETAKAEKSSEGANKEERNRKV